MSEGSTQCFSVRMLPVKRREGYIRRVGPWLRLPCPLIELDWDSDLLAGPFCLLNCIFLSIASTAGVIWSRRSIPFQILVSIVRPGQEASAPVEFVPTESLSLITVLWWNVNSGRFVNECSGCRLIFAWVSSEIKTNPKFCHETLDGAVW